MYVLLKLEIDSSVRQITAFSISISISTST